MDGRPLLENEGKLCILVDSNSISKLLSKSDNKVERLLKYYDSDSFDFIRTPLETDNHYLKEIIHFSKNTNVNGSLSGIEIDRKERNTRIYFPYKIEDVEAVAKERVTKNFLANEEKESVFLVFIQAILNDGGNNLFITNDDLLLKNRLWFESHFPGRALNIVTAEEAMEIMDLFAKNRGIYYMSSRGIANKGLWYWLSFRSKIPYYNVSTEILHALAFRFICLLVSLDEMGIQYYSGVNNDTIDDTLYHFNYFISLITGIFDALALETCDRLQVKFAGDHVPWKISLNNKTGEDFLKVVRDKNPDLRNHINAYVDFIKLIYALRELVIHREGLPDSGFEYRGQDAKWKAIFVYISKNIADLIKVCGDKKKLYEVVTDWGVYQDTLGYYLSPYNFAKATVSTLIKFSNEYLRLLGFPNFIQSLHPTDNFLQDIRRFESSKLGF